MRFFFDCLVASVFVFLMISIFDISFKEKPLQSSIPAITEEELSVKSEIDPLIFENVINQEIVINNNSQRIYFSDGTSFVSHK